MAGRRGRGRGRTIQKLSLEGWTDAQRTALHLLVERAGIRARWDHRALRVPPDDVAQVRVFMDFLSDVPDDVVMDLAETSHFEPLPVRRSPAAPVPRRRDDLPVPDVAMPSYRFATFLVDGLLLGAVTIPLYRWLGSPFGTVLTGVIGAVYGILMLRLLGRTVGNIATKTRVVALADRSRPGWRAAIVRWLVANGLIFLTWVPGSGFIGFAWFVAVYLPILVGPEYRGLHDRAAGVVVLDDRLNPTSGIRRG
jgi:uncharacterized RDD family membrane protein YckC